MAELDLGYLRLGLQGKKGEREMKRLIYKGEMAMGLRDWDSWVKNEKKIKMKE